MHICFNVCYKTKIKGKRERTLKMKDDWADTRLGTNTEHQEPAENVVETTG